MMNWKKLLLIGLTVGGFAFATASPSQAGVSIGIGFPGYYPPYYPYGYYPYPYYRGYYGPGVYLGPRYYWYHGHRVFYHRRHW
jgi:hypothetical protein